MLDDIKAIYTSAWAFALACPLLFLVPVAAEMAQHVAEIHIGFYDRLNDHSSEPLDGVYLRIIALVFGLASLSLIAGIWLMEVGPAG